MKFSNLFFTLFFSLSLLGVPLSFAEGGGGIECPATSGVFTYVSGSAVYQTNSFEGGEIGILHCEYETESEEEIEPFGEVIAIFHVSGELSQELVDEYGCGAILGKQYSSTYVISETHFSSVAFSTDPLMVAAGLIMAQIENQNLATTCIASENQGSTVDVVMKVIEEHEVIEDKAEEVSQSEIAEIIESIPLPIAQPQIVLPNWIKNNAGWWASDQITDTDFADGIEFMIKEGYIKIPPTETSETTESGTPNREREKKQCKKQIREFHLIIDGFNSVGDSNRKAVCMRYVQDALWVQGSEPSSALRDEPKRYSGLEDAVRDQRGSWGSFDSCRFSYLSLIVLEILVLVLDMFLVLRNFFVNILINFTFLAEPLIPSTGGEVL